MEAEGFPYRRLLIGGRVSDGVLTMEQAVLDSDALGVAATGTLGIVNYNAHLSVLVAPFSSVNRLVRAIPIVGYLIGWNLTSVPVGVSGDIRDPLVVPLGPNAITSELLGIFERTLKLPGHLFAPLTPEPAQGKK